MRFEKAKKLINDVIEFVNSHPFLEGTIAGILSIAAAFVWCAIAFYIMP